MDPLEHRVSHDAFLDTLNKEGCHFGRMLEQAAKQTHDTDLSKIVDLEYWQKEIQGVTLPRIGGNAENAKKEAEEAKKMAEAAKNMVDKIFLRVFLGVLLANMLGLGAIMTIGFVFLKAGGQT